MCDKRQYEVSMSLFWIAVAFIIVKGELCSRYSSE